MASALATSTTHASTATGLRKAGATGAAMIRVLAAETARPAAPKASSAAAMASHRLRPHHRAAT